MLKYGDEVTITKGKFKGSTGYFTFYTNSLDKKKGTVRFSLAGQPHEESVPVAWLQPTPLAQPQETIF